MNADKFENLLIQLIEGKIDFLTYRKKRTELIQKIMYSEAISPPINIITLCDQQAKPTLDIPVLDEKVEPANFPVMQISIVALLVIFGVLSWHLSNTPSEPTTEPLHKKKTLATNTSPENKMNDEPFIVAFNQKTKWDTESVSDFLVQWQSLSHSRQLAARKSNSFLQLSQLLRERIQTLRSLKKNQSKPTERLEKLYIWLSSQLSISIN
ncbi:MAG TPA: hypothetical protein ENK06_12120 [Gammaproteobacteria bacterium]|nr:hypothetical protein [Gammaproteobacteria bacterium]